jgi:two-component system response regulator DctR
VLQKVLINIGYSNVHIATNGFDGIAMAIDHRPDLVFLDLMMPEIDGVTTLQVIKTIPITADTKIIICSANTDMHNLAKIIELGAVDFISKPFTSDTVQAKLNNLLT